MTRKLMVLALAAVLVVAVAIPVTAQERTVAPKLQKISKRALKTSKRALKTSKQALRTSRAARLAAQRAEGAAGAAGVDAAAAKQVAAAAQGTATAAQARLDANATAVGSAPGTVATVSETFVALPGGPSVTVTVPPSGLIEVWAQATLEAGSVSLYEDGEQMPGQSEDCAPEGAGGALFSGEGGRLVGTPAVPPFCSASGAPGAVLFQTTPGTHTYELRYATTCACEEAPAPTISDRRLYVAPRP